MRHTTPELPQEIVNAVVKDLALQTDFKALKTLGLVSRSWSHPTREHLFRAITIEMRSFPSLQNRLDTLDLLLQENPLLCHSIKSLTIDVDLACPYTGWSNLKVMEAEYNSFMWTDFLIGFPSLLTSLTHVFVGVEERDSFDPPRYLPHSFQNALQTLFARPHVTSVSLSYIEIDLIPLTQHHHIEKLSLHGVSVPAWSQACCFPMNRPPTTPKSLRALSLCLVYASVWRVLTLCCASPEATLNLGEIKDLSVTPRWGPRGFETLEDKQWATIFNTYGKTVECYTLRQRSHREPFSTITPLWSCPNLSQLSFEIKPEDLSNDSLAMSSLAKALEERSQLDKPINLASIRVKYFGCADYIKHEFEEHGENKLWARLDGILEGRAFSCLKEVVFTLEVSCCSGCLDGKKEWDDFADMVHLQWLPGLSRSGILTLRCHFCSRTANPFFIPPPIIKTLSR